jgi:membrane protein required for colicin V production
MTFTWIDYAIIAIILISTMISLFRGFIKEIVSLVIWIVAFILAFHYSTGLSEQFRTHIASDSLRLTISFVLILIGTLLIGAVVKFIMNRIKSNSEVGMTDRILGTVLGLLRGIFLVVMLILLGQLTTFNQSPAWQNSVLIPHFEFLVDWSKHLIPNDFEQYISFKPLEPA